MSLELQTFNVEPGSVLRAINFIPLPAPANPSNRRLIRHRHDALRLVIDSADSPRFSRHRGESLEIHLLASLLCRFLLLRILLDAAQEVVPRPRLLDVFDSDVDALLNIPISHSPVKDNADGRFRHVVDNTGLAMVDLVWHTTQVLTSVSFEKGVLSWID